ncbi:cutinase-domain-containing protein [Xylariales sp. AK1849]|nr:cutinase-domain-containing protein [Xylariales sp. AK1849]
MKTTSAAFSAVILAALSTASPVPQSTSAADCKTYTVLFARGTSETGTLGTIVGPGLQTSVETALGTANVVFEGVTYAADIAGITAEATGSGPGSVAMNSQATTWLSDCPQTTIVLAGYSQGAMVVHNAASKLNSASKISSVGAAVTFGDPFKTELPAGITTAEFHTFCASGDSVCGSTGTCAGTGGCTSESTSGHLGYGADVDTAAAFIKSAVGSVATISSLSSVSSVATPTSTLSLGTTADSDSSFSGLPTSLPFSIPTSLPFTIPLSFPTSFPTGLPTGL